MAVRTRKNTTARQTRNAEATKKALIEAGERLFSKFGFKGATVDMLASEAGANKALVSYYFGSKEGLYDAVIAALVSDVVEDVTAALSDDGDPAARFRHYVLALARAFAARPSFPAILMREYIDGSMQMREGPFREVFRFFQVTEKLYRAGRRKKLFRKLDAHQLHLSIVGPLVHFTLTQRFRAETFERYEVGVSNPQVEEFARYLADLLLDGMRRDE